jgi:hypothetical protein
MPSPNDNLPKRIWEVTVQVSNGDWHWSRTTTEVTFDEAVDQAVWFKSNFDHGHLISIMAVPEGSAPARLGPGLLFHYHKDLG